MIDLSNQEQVKRRKPVSLAFVVVGVVLKDLIDLLPFVIFFRLTKIDQVTDTFRQNNSLMKKTLR
jgi:hypothetical protein